MIEQKPANSTRPGLSLKLRVREVDETKAGEGLGSISPSKKDESWTLRACVLVIVLGQARTNVGEGVLLGIGAILTSALCYAVNIVLMRRQALAYLEQSQTSGGMTKQEAWASLCLALYGTAEFRYVD